ncbi:MAG TPA: aspartate aminotransferase family protein [Acidocella sp.]|nr:aspartate aminotransferase family protein [Acidocella sp.]
MIAALMPNYNRIDLAFEHGEGAWLVDAAGRRFLDFGAGIATSSLGHGHPGLTRAIAEQAAKVIHVSNLYRIPQAERLAQRLVDASFADSVFFCNSGAEANEGLIKAMRKTMSDAGQPERYRIICFEGAFHGRTLATLSATGNAKYLAGFGPAVEGFDHVPFGDLAAVKAAITPQTAGILIEPIQGEGGIHAAPAEFLQALRALCDETGLLLGFDEVQCGMGRTGKLFAHEWSAIAPDILSSAKGIGGGFPMGAVLARERVAKALVPGSHGTTFGGSPLACAAGNAVLDVILHPGFLDQVQATGETLAAGLSTLCARYPAVFTEVRGMGLLRGLKCAIPNTEAQAAALAQGLLTVAAGDNVLRLIPPLIIGEAECADAIARLARAAETFCTAPALETVK